MKKTFTKNELIIFKRLLIQNRDSAKLQKISECSYLESIALIGKIEELLL